MLKVLVKTLIDNGFIKNQTADGSCLYLKEIYDRYSLGFRLEKKFKGRIPIFFGLLDDRMCNIQCQVECYENKIINGFTYEFPLNFFVHASGKFSFIEENELHVLTQKMSELEIRSSEFILNYEEYLNGKSVTLLLNQHNVNDLLFEYYQLLFKLTNDEMIKTDDVDLLLANKSHLDSKHILIYRLNLLRHYLNK